jgi:hypothetical protein
MKNLINIFFVSLLLLSVNSFAQDEISEGDCKSGAILEPAKNIIKDLEAVTAGLYKDIATFKVNHDGEGKLSVYYEKGVPKILKFSYQNGSVVITKTFEELEKGAEIVYKNNDYPGKAIVLKKSGNFKDGSKYKFNLMLRSKVKPEEHKTYPIEFDSTASAPKLYYKDNKFKSIEISPGLRFLSWNGTFTGAEFNK